MTHFDPVFYLSQTTASLSFVFKEFILCMACFYFQVSLDGQSTDPVSLNPFSPATDSHQLASVSPQSGVARDELEAYLTCFGEMNLGPEEDAEPACCQDTGIPKEKLEDMVEELRVKLEKTSGFLGEPEPPDRKQEEEEEAKGALTCAPDPVPLHIALKNDLQAQVELQQRLAQQLMNSQVTKVTNDRPLMAAGRRRKEPIGEEGQQNKQGGKGNQQLAKQAQLAKQESVSSLASSSDSAPSEPAFPPPQARESLVPPDGTSVDPLPYFTPPTGSPVRDNSEESNPSSSSLSSGDNSSRASSEEVDLTNVVPVTDGGADLANVSETGQLDLSNVVPVSDPALDLTSVVQSGGLDVSNVMTCHPGDAGQLGNLVTMATGGLSEQMHAGAEGVDLSYVLPVPDSRLGKVLGGYQVQQQLPPPQQFTPHQMQLLQEQLRHHQILRQRLKMAKGW